MQPYFRDAVGGDLHAIASIMCAAAPHDAAQRTATAESYRRALDQIDRHDGSYVLVGEYDRQIGAVIHIVVFPQLHGGGGRIAEIVGLWVADAFRTSGIDTMLLERAIARADDLGCRNVRAMAAGSRRHEQAFWERAGFVRLEAGFVRSLEGVPILRQIS